MPDLIKEFNDYREKMNEVILSKNNLVMKRFWNLDTNTYEEGALDKKTKEMRVVMTVSNIIWENRMSSALLPNRYMKCLPLQILSEALLLFPTPVAPQNIGKNYRNKNTRQIIFSPITGILFAPSLSKKIFSLLLKNEFFKISRV